MRATLRKSEILRGRITFQQIFEKGEKRSGKILRCFLLERPIDSLSPLVVGFVVRRTISRAVDRNRLKRLLRESYRNNKIILHSALTAASSNGLSIVFMYSPQRPLPVKSVTYEAIDREMKSLLLSIAQRYSS